MHLFLLVSVAATLAVTATACSGETDPSPATGGSSGTSTGGTSTGGTATGGTSTGGTATGGTSTGGTSTGGTATGGTSTGGTTTGGTGTGGTTTGGTSTGGTATGGTTTGGTTTGGTATGGTSAGGSSGGAAVGYAKDVQPILKAKCGTCHSGANQGGHNLTTTYADAKKPAESRQFDECWSGRDPESGELTGPKPMGECALLLTRAGKMPAFLACDSASPPEPAKCVTKAEVDVLAAWVAGGMAP